MAIQTPAPISKNYSWPGIEEKKKAISCTTEILVIKEIKTTPQLWLCFAKEKETEDNKL